MFSDYLKSRHDICKELVQRLSARYSYVSLLGKHVTGTSIRVSSVNVSINDTMEKQCGFVIKLFNGKTYSEYSFSDIDRNSIDQIEKDVIDAASLDESLLENHVDVNKMKDAPMVKDFVRPMEGKKFTEEEITTKLTNLKNKMHSLSDKIIQVMTIFTDQEISSMFITSHKDMTQNYYWANAMAFAVARDGSNIKSAYDVTGYNSMEKALDEIEPKAEKVVKLAEELLHATLIEPGVYDIITDPSITGLIAHEAFGHGVEMDMYVKDRALSKYYIGKEVASSLVEMHDGASATHSVASYFFDDDGVLAHDTLIIKNGILQTGISDAVSALQLKSEPTGNGRRESYKRKAYTRMTNTFFSPGKDKVEDMIKSIKHGYMLFQTSNGMEDPKNWNIQCVAQYGREIKDGKFTGKIVTPVCMTGYVPDLLKSISMVSDEWVVTGSGHCGKGYKEMVCVSDGGPYLKARCKLS